MSIFHQESADLLESMPEALIVTNPSGQVMFTNSRTEEMFGYPRDELIGHPMGILLSPSSANEARYGVRRNGEEFPVEVSAGSVHCPGGARISNLVRDVTARRRGEEMCEREKEFAERANAKKSWVLAAASHDLRQPLQSLSLYASMLRGRSDNEIVLGLAERMTRPLESMRQILDSLLDILELEGGSIRTARGPVGIQRLLEGACEDNIRQATAKGLSLSVTPTDCIAFTDPRLLERALANLVANAIQHSHGGSVTMRCVRGEGTARIEVSDTGPGIPEDRLERIFDEYCQLDNPEREREKGFGLGLSIVKKIAELLEHSLDVVSAPGQGSVFSIEMPLAEATERAALVAPYSVAHKAAENGRGSTRSEVRARLSGGMGRGRRDRSGHRRG